jgi:hypothetical protein
MRRITLLLLTACSGITPHVDALEVQPAECGRYTATVRGGGLYGDAELRVDDQPVRSWPISGALDVTHEGTLTLDRGPGRAVQFELTAGGTFIRREVSFPDLTLEGEVVLAPIGGKGRLTGRLVALCPLMGATWSAELVPGGSVGPLPLPEDGALAAELPTLGKELPAVRLVLHTPDGRDRALVPEVRFAAARDADSDEPDDAPPSAMGEGRDADHDGYAAGVDCDDRSPRVNPGMSEDPEPNQIDDNCDGRVDEGTRAFDDDGDGYSEDRGDCDDDDTQRKPGGRELPDCRDQDCDGEIDEGVTLPQIDDTQEPNGTLAQATDLQTGSDRSFTRTLRWVTTSAADEEWVRFHSDDGLLDDWGIDVTLYRAAPGASFQVELFKERTSLSQTLLSEEGAQHRQRGTAMSSDSGDYWLRIKPVVVPKAYCPVEVRITSR